MADPFATELPPVLPDDIEFDFSQFCLFPSAEDVYEDVSASHNQAQPTSGDTQQPDEPMASPSSSISGGVMLSDVVENGNLDPKTADDTNASAAETTSKAGSRFTSTTIRVLRAWFDNHERYPYPTPEEVERLQKRTGLSKQQLTNWFANTRRRKRFCANGTASPRVPSFTEPGSGPIDIPARRPTPMPFEQMNPLQRWEHSPPEHEPALVSDISRAVAASSSRRSGLSNRSRSSARSSDNASSVSSVGTSRSSRGSRSNGSAYSYGSNASPVPTHGIRKDSSRRRRRAMAKGQRDKPKSLMQTRNLYQCTFCAETFKTKYDWQRHEKTLHLSLEEWVCSPGGAIEIDPERGILCVYCDEVGPDQHHLDGHHQAACSDRPLDERTFYRKDHLRQHLKLVHRTKKMTKCAEKWKVTTDAIRSRCGFCDAALESWSHRGDHIADHYRSDGITMSDWKGDWGFEPSVLAKLENAVPPYLIQWEQSAPVPFCANDGPADTCPSAYELLKLELEYFVRNFFEAHEALPSDDDLVYEGCTIIFGSQLFSPDLDPAASSWLRDLFMDATEIAARARLRPMNQLAKLRMSQLRIKGKADIFEDCELESQLCRHLREHTSLGLAVSDAELQQEACATLYRVEASSTNPSRRFAGFLVRLISESTGWIESLRQRAEQFVGDPYLDFGPVQATLESLADDPMNGLFGGGLGGLGQMTLGSGSQPVPSGTGDRMATGGGGGGGGDALASFLEPVMYSQPPGAGPGLMPDDLFKDGASASASASVMGAQDFYSRLQTSKTLFAGSGFSLGWTEQPSAKGIPFFLNDPNRYGRLAGELSRFVASSMSPNNPNKHVPTDDEIRYQARWIFYDDDDPWNQTPADTPEWLAEFKKQVGLP
ncbi:C2H2 type zinc finger domain-containing protein [Colletotrichum higginsianum IMI 349063]|uniref:C2H2 type zinc finger domain-containing protein n=1 Tax=Colletotrichum higginsianum (strain IMI 349063) TaxID=759273 RepID=A0A1B7Y506_COLHI|nr:C2H2 type zinc finger domain-containing protein [Colletotrichum higginsianum IMI 349063]OBR07122.1 C2H2 type zinc finger domain-containing protein [Colletotrichum higginsianum IMI 349063]